MAAIGADRWPCVPWGILGQQRVWSLGVSINGPSKCELVGCTTDPQAQMAADLDFQSTSHGVGTRVSTLREWAGMSNGYR